MVAGLATPSAARTGTEAAAQTPRTVPALGGWQAERGSYEFGRGTRIVVDQGEGAARRVAATLAEDLKADGKGTVPVVAGPAREGDIVLAVVPGRQKSLKKEGYELRVGEQASITGATEAGAFYGTRTLLQLLAAGDTVPAGHTVENPAYAERGVGVCACYIHISTEWLENLVRDMSYLHLNQLLLELKVKSERHPEANTWGYYTKDEIRRLVALGEKYHVTIIPEINSPGHMDPWIAERPDLQLTDTDGKPQPSRLDVTKPEAFDYYTSLMDEYAQVFKAKAWHMGADEYMLGSDFAKYPHVAEYAKAKYGPDATPQDAFIDFVNRVHAYAEQKGKQLRIWNDGLTGDNTVPVEKGTVVEHWLNVKTKPSEIVRQGYEIMNASYALYLIRGGFHSDTRKLYEEKWDPRSFEGEKLTGAESITGAKISFWPDNGKGETENEVAAGAYLPLRHIAQATWGEPAPDATYEEFAARAQAVGHAPGWRDLTRVPVQDGSYRFEDTKGRMDPVTWRVERTGDGYATLTSPSTGLCAETRSGKITLNTPLEPGSAITQESCSASNTLQRWQLTKAAGGYRLTNAITRMAAHVTSEGKLVQYPADQQTPAVWRLTPERS
ncbi:family 20 glycosylhydrolase [Streptomyces pathocidini]|uniref:Family 20 glycosylhydrolase n=1 Tax=Streptomyces pathocidini TaxID=1650571 RepID=A0ABW7UQT0_9ACTN|nr:family 20 glycosylhydrolase [Streptomyces pathocidini]